MDQGLQYCTGGGDQNHPKEKEMQEGKVVFWGGFINSWEKREAKSKGKREIYTQLNAEFQRIVRSDKKALLSEQCKEIEENNRMGKTRGIFKNLEIPKEHFM